MPDCSISSCDRPAIARGWCHAHYKRWQKHGDPDQGGPLPLSGHGKCRVEGCENAAHQHGYCASHKHRLDVHGDARAGRRPRNSDPDFCSVDGCERAVVSRGLCNNHYKRVRAHGDPLAGGISPLRGQSLQARHAHYTDQRQPDECWPWLASLSPKGYGQLQDGTSNVAAHRVAYEMAHGPIPEGHQVHHTCETKACQNPAHLVAMEPGAHTLAGSGFSGTNSRKTHCKRGHPLTPDNVYSYGGNRACKTCAIQRARSQGRRSR